MSALGSGFRETPRQPARAANRQSKTGNAGNACLCFHGNQLRDARLAISVKSAHFFSTIPEWLKSASRSASRMCWTDTLKPRLRIAARTILRLVIGSLPPVVPRIQRAARRLFSGSTTPAQILPQRETALSRRKIPAVNYGAKAQESGSAQDLGPGFWRIVGSFRRFCL